LRSRRTRTSAASWRCFMEPRGRRHRRHPLPPRALAASRRHPRGRTWLRFSPSWKRTTSQPPCAGRSTSPASVPSSSPARCSRWARRWRPSAARRGDALRPPSGRAHPWPAGLLLLLALPSARGRPSPRSPPSRRSTVGRQRQRHAWAGGGHRPAQRQRSHHPRQDGHHLRDRALPALAGNALPGSARAPGRQHHHGRLRITPRIPRTPTSCS